MTLHAFVTGATGFVGRHLVSSLLRRGFFVTALARDPERARRVLGPSPRIISGTLGDIAAIRSCLKDCTHLFHLAGVTKALDSEEFYRVNHRDTESLYNLVRQAALGIRRVLHVGTLASCGPAPSRIPPEVFPNPSPVTHYGRSKLLGENSALELSREIPLTIVRPPAVFGPYDTDVLEFFRAVCRGLLPIIGHDDKLVSLVYAPDLAEGMIQAALCPEAAGRSYFICYPDPMRWSELGAIAAHAAGKKCRKVTIPLTAVRLLALVSELSARLSRKPTILNREKIREIEQDFWICSPSPAIRDFGFQPSMPIGQAFEETIRWYRDHGQLPR